MVQPLLFTTPSGSEAGFKVSVNFWLGSTAQQRECILDCLSITLLDYLCDLSGISNGGLLYFHVKVIQPIHLCFCSTFAGLNTESSGSFQEKMCLQTGSGGI